jgi:hypothetical protein
VLPRALCIHPEALGYPHGQLDSGGVSAFLESGQQHSSRWMMRPNSKLRKEIDHVHQQGWFATLCPTNS